MLVAERRVVDVVLSLRLVLYSKCLNHIIDHRKARNTLMSLSSNDSTDLCRSFDLMIVGFGIHRWYLSDLWMSYEQLCARFF